MTQLGEAVSIGMFVDEDTECPFSHDPPPDKQIPQNLIGTGTKLASRMKSGRSTALVKDAPGYEEAAKLKVDKPLVNPKHPFHKSKQPAITIRFEGAEDAVKYPVNCAAHHLIPAQESLKKSRLVKYMIAKENPGDGGNVKTGSNVEQKTGACWSNLGYDVNGSQNGIFLPGSYAVHDGTWVPIEEEDKDYPPGHGSGADPVRLSGTVICDGKLSRKWLYVEQAIQLASSFKSPGYGGQFHDRHEAYSDFVLKTLNTLHAQLRKSRMTSIIDEQCGECKDIAEKFAGKGIPTSPRLIVRLNVVSSRLGMKLKGTTWYPGLYTSDWGKAYIEMLQQQSATSG